MGANGAGGGHRTHDLMITNHLLCHLSYTSLYALPDLRRGCGLCWRRLSHTAASYRLRLMYSERSNHPYGYWSG